MGLSTNYELQLAVEFVQHTNRNVFLTGRAGTGKTTFLRELKNKLPKRMVVVAPTGVAAINAGGVTIHSFFQMPFGPFIPGTKRNEGEGSPIFKLSREKINLIRSIDLLVIDEISMVRADLLDGIDEVLRRFKTRTAPFGGVQLLMIGDLNQLAPVVKDDEWNMLRNFYSTPFFFGSRALASTQYICIELKHVYRQTDTHFIDLLNRIRNNSLNADTLNLINSRYVPNIALNAPEGFITLTTHNNQANTINQNRLQQLNSAETTFRAQVGGDFPEYMYPTEFDLTLKLGAQVMLVKNHSAAEKLYYNGKIGKIIEIDDETILVECPGDDAPIEVVREVWQNCKYSLNEQALEIQETVVGTFSQYPLKLAWAITIHKSQGLTFDNVIIDAQAAFAFGQVYVSLSRCRTFEGLHLNSKITERSIKTDNSIDGFTREMQENPPTHEELNQSKLEYEKSLVLDLFNFNGIYRVLAKVAKDLNENFSSFPSESLRTVEELNSTFNKEVQQVNEKFSSQLSHLLAGNPNVQSNPLLSERIIKASEYFIQKLQIIDFKFQNLDIDSDNKAIRKIVADGLKHLLSEINMKVCCLRECQNGFTIKGYLNAKLKASLEPLSVRKHSKDWQRDKEASQTNSLYTILKNWRDQTADSHGVSMFMVLPFKTLRVLSETQPCTLNELKKIKGLGKKKVESFGIELLDLIRKYREELGLYVPPEIEDITSKKERLQKPHTREVSYSLFVNGRSVEQIAQYRQMLTSTIIEHLSYYVANGDLDIEMLIDSEKIKYITDTIKRIKSRGIKPVKDALGSDYSYSDIKLVKAWLKRINF